MNGKRWNAGRSLRIAPLQGAYPIRNESCRERPMCRSVLFARYSATNGYILPLYYTPNHPVCQEGEIAGERRTRGFVPRSIRDSLKSPEIQNFPHKDLPCNAGRSLWGKFLGSRGASSKEAPEWGAGQSPATFSLHQLVLQRSLSCIRQNVSSRQR